jgi:hypothetical protein
MNFRIRSNNDDKDIMLKNEKYLNYLKKFNMNQNKDLWSFFGTDFFHDGQIQNFQFSTDMRNLSFKIACPNIKHNNVYIEPIWFTCLFEGVVSFQMEVLKVDDYNNPLAENEDVLFLESEINTLTEEMEKYNNLYKDEFFSIIIKTLPIQRDFSIIFRALTVTPIEPLAFEIIKQDKKYEIPFFTR